MILRYARQRPKQRVPRKGTRLFAVLAAICLFLATAAVPAATLSLSCGAVGVELEVCRQGAEAWAARSGHEVRIVSTPNASNERLALYQQLLASHSPDLDVIQIDVVWPGVLHPHLLDLAPHVAAQTLAEHLPVLIGNDTVDGRLVALPWFVDAGLLYYRKDLLERHGRPVPQTWHELTATAAAVQAAERAAGNPLWGYVFQGRAYEGLTCNALEWVYSHGGGTIVDEHGRPTIDNPRAAAALRTAADWIGDIAPPGVLNYDEEQARGAFHSGRALFMRNWPYAWPLLEAPDSPLRGKVGVAPLPSGGAGLPHGSTLGGWQLAVSRYSRHPEAAVDLVRFLTAPAEQRRRAVEAGYHPTYPALYRDPAVLASSPSAALMKEVLADAVARPSDALGRDYNQGSYAFWNAVHAVLSGRRNAGQSLARLEERLERLARRRGR